jgi:hypothetical protein
MPRKAIVPQKEAEMQRILVPRMEASFELTATGRPVPEAAGGVRLKSV